MKTQRPAFLQQLIHGGFNCDRHEHSSHAFFLSLERFETVHNLSGKFGKHPRCHGLMETESQADSSQRWYGIFSAFNDAREIFTYDLTSVFSGRSLHLPKASTIQGAKGRQLNNVQGQADPICSARPEAALEPQKRGQRGAEPPVGPVLYGSAVTRKIFVIAAVLPSNRCLISAVKLAAKTGAGSVGRA